MKAYWVANYTEIKDDERLKKYAIKANIKNNKVLQKFKNNFFT